MSTGRAGAAFPKPVHGGQRQEDNGPWEVRALQCLCLVNRDTQVPALGKSLSSLSHESLM